ncbi:MAG TPA: hypothetical protein VMX38_08475 [Verrucomicrobiae bacterium]|nr:hypothetical protein [Verrucomicrobiae bacterium]
MASIERRRLAVKMKNFADWHHGVPGLPNVPVGRPWIVKAYFLLCLAGGVIGLSVMIVADIRIP